VARYNDLGSVQEIFEANPGRIAALIVEPVAGNMGVVPPEPGFLQGLRELTSNHGAVLIFDEVMTGFRVHPGGAQGLYGIAPDLTTLGKVIGGGLPVGAYGGRREIMEMVAPSGPVYQAGTLSGNPLAMTAGIETLRILRSEILWKTLEDRARRLCDGIRAAAAEAGVRVQVQRAGSMFATFFVGRAPMDFDSVKRSDTKQFATFFRSMLQRGIYLAPSQFEAAFVSTAHGEAEIERTLQAANGAFQDCRQYHS
jgi:glutamate-1-semialdehyde 2,1-aminomutase